MAEGCREEMGVNFGGEEADAGEGGVNRARHKVFSLKLLFSFPPRCVENCTACVNAQSSVNIKWKSDRKDKTEHMHKGLWLLFKAHRSH